MSDQDRRIIELIDKTAACMDRTSALMREIGVELKALRRDLEDHERRIRNLEGNRRG